MRRRHVESGKVDLMETHVWTTTGTNGRKRNKALNEHPELPCRSCNTGWMSRLEHVKPRLEELMDGKSMLLADPLLRQLIGAWGLKTIMMVHRTYMTEQAMAIDRDLIPKAHFHALYRNRTRPPDCVVIWLAFSEMGKGDIGGTLHGDQFAHYQITPVRLNNGLPVHAAVDGDDGYLATLRIKHLVFQVLGVDDPSRVIRSPDTVEPFSLIPMQLWPLSDPITWPPSRGLASEQLPAFARRFTRPLLNFALPTTPKTDSGLLIARSMEQLSA